jgi:hypothetical protein
VAAELSATLLDQVVEPFAGTPADRGLVGVA